MMMIFNWYAELFQRDHNLVPDLIVIVAGRGCLVSLIVRQRVTIRVHKSAPVCFPGIDLAKGEGGAVFESDLIKDIKLKFRTPQGFVRDASRNHPLFCASSDFAWVELVQLFCIRFVHTAKASKGGLAVEGVHKRCAKVWDEHHIAGIYVFETHAGAVETNTLRHHVLREFPGCQREMMQVAP